MILNLIRIIQLSLTQNIEAQVGTGIKKINFLVEEQNLRKLLSNTPKSTKEWVNGKINFLGNNTQKIKYRYHGDNPGNWLFEKKQFKIK